MDRDVGRRPWSPVRRRPPAPGGRTGPPLDHVENPPCAGSRSRRRVDRRGRRQRDDRGRTRRRDATGSRRATPDTIEDSCRRLCRMVQRLLRFDERVTAETSVTGPLAHLGARSCHIVTGWGHGHPLRSSLPSSTSIALSVWERSPPSTVTSSGGRGCTDSTGPPSTGSALAMHRQATASLHAALRRDAGRRRRSRPRSGTHRG